MKPYLIYFLVPIFLRIHQEYEEREKKEQGSLAVWGFPPVVVEAYHLHWVHIILAHFCRNSLALPWEFIFVRCSRWIELSIIHFVKSTANLFRGFLNHPGLMVFKWRVMFRSIIVKGRWIWCHGKCPWRIFSMISLISILKFARVHVHILLIKKKQPMQEFSRFAGLLLSLISSNLCIICLYFFDHDQLIILIIYNIY